MLKVVVHVNEKDRLPVAVTNVINLIKDLGQEQVRPAVLLNGGAVEVLRPGGEISGQLERLAGAGVEILACRNSLRSLGFLEADLPAYVRVVPAGITELVRRQHAGWAYVKP